MTTELERIVMCGAKIEDGWCFSTADFSIIAGGGSQRGRVMFVRSPEDRARWHEMSDELKEDEVGPPLYVTGLGMTLEEAVINANLAASHARPIST